MKVKSILDLQKLSERELLLFQAEATYRLDSKIDTLLSDYSIFKKEQRETNDSFKSGMEGIRDDILGIKKHVGMMLSTTQEALG